MIIGKYKSLIIDQPTFCGLAKYGSKLPLSNMSLAMVKFARFREKTQSDNANLFHSVLEPNEIRQAIGTSSYYLCIVQGPLSVTLC